MATVIYWIPKDLDSMYLNAVKNLASFIKIEYTEASGKYEIDDGNTAVNVMKKGSAYIIDYILLYFNDVINKMKYITPDIMYDVSFAQFVMYAEEAYRIVTESRASPTYEAEGPFGSATKIYSCHTGSHVLIKDDIDHIRATITAPGSTFARVYQNYADLNALLFNDRYKEGCGENSVQNFFIDVLFPALKFYEDSRIEHIDTKKVADAQKRIQKNLAKINNALTSFGYTEKCDSLQKIYNSTVKILPSVTGIISSNLETIESTADISIFYDTLEFKNSDIDDALVTPKDIDDLISKDEITKIDSERSTKILSSVTSAGLLGSLFGATPKVIQLNKTQNYIKGITNEMKLHLDKSYTPKDIDKIGYTKIFQDITDGNKKKAEYLSKTAQLRITKKTLKKQAAFLNLIADDTQPQTRMTEYKLAYPTVHIGAGTTAIETYSLEQNTKPVYYTQSGGTRTDIDSVRESQKISKTIVGELNASIDKIDDIIKKISATFLDNESFLDEKTIRDKNDFMIASMNMIKLYTYMIGRDSKSTTDFMNKIDEISEAFEAKLTEHWDALDEDAKIDLSDDDTLDALLAMGAIVSSDVQKLLNEMKIAPVDNINSMLNSASTLKDVEFVAKKIGTDNTNLLIEKINHMFTSGTHEPSVYTPEEIYKEIYTIYDNLKSFNSLLKAEFDAVKHDAANYNSIKTGVGTVITKNIEIINEFISTLINYIETINTKTSLFNGIYKEIMRSSLRINKISVIVNEAYNKVKAYTDPVDNTLIDTDGTIVINHNFSFDPNVYVNDYIKKIKDASTNISLHNKYSANKHMLQNIKQNIAVDIFNLRIIKKALFKHPDRLRLIEYVPAAYGNIYMRLRDKLLQIKYILWYYPNLLKQIKIPNYMEVILDMIPLYSNTLNTAYDIFASVPEIDQSYKDEFISNALIQAKKTLISREKLRGLDHTDVVANINELDLLYTVYIAAPDATKNNARNALFDKIRDVIPNNADADDLFALTAEITRYIQTESVNTGIELAVANGYQFERILVGQYNTIFVSIVQLFNKYLQSVYKSLAKNSFVNAKHSVFTNNLRTQLSITNNLNQVAEQINLIPNITSAIKENLVINFKDANASAGYDDDRYTDYEYAANAANTPENIRNIYLWLNTNAAENPFITRDLDQRKKIDIISNSFDKYYNDIVPIFKTLIHIRKSTILNVDVISNVRYTPVRVREGMVDISKIPFPIEVTIDGVLYPDLDDGGFDTMFNSDGAEPNPFRIAPHGAGPVIQYKVEYETLTVYDAITNTYTIVSDAAGIRIHNINLQPRSVEFHSVTPPGVTPEALKKIVEILNTVKVSFYCLKRFNNLLHSRIDDILYYDLIKRYDVESPITGSTQIPTTHPAYKKRAMYKKIIIKMCATLLKVIHYWNSKKSEMYGPSFIDPFSTGYLRDGLNLMRNIDPSTPGFNVTRDRIFYAARKLLCVYYTIVANAIREFLMVNTWDDINKLIPKIQFSATGEKVLSYSNANINRFFGIAAPPSFKIQYSFVRNFYNMINNEVNAALAIVDASLANTQINIEPDGDPSHTRHVIDDAFFNNIIEFDSVYKKNTHAYHIFALIRRGYNAQFAKFQSVNRHVDAINEVLRNMKSVLATKFIYQTITNTEDDTGASDDSSASDDSASDNSEEDVDVSEEDVDVSEEGYTRDKKGFVELIRDVINKFKERVTNIFPPVGILDPNSFSTGLLQGITNVIDDESVIPLNISSLLPKTLINVPLSADGAYTLLPHGLTLMHIDPDISPNMKRVSKYLYNVFVEEDDDAVDPNIENKIRRFVFSILVRKMYSGVRDFVCDCIDKITQRINDMKVLDLSIIRNIVINHATHALAELNMEPKPPVVTLDIVHNDNADKIKFIIVSTAKYQANKNEYDKMFHMITEVLTYAKSTIRKTYTNELTLNKQITDIERTNIDALHKLVGTVNEQSDLIKKRIKQIGMVMFNSHFKKYSFVDNTQLTFELKTAASNYTTLENILGQFNKQLQYNNDNNAIRLSQLVNYQGFISILNKSFGGVQFIEMFYRRLSFGLVEYYYDVLSSILNCLDKDFESMSDIERYLYMFHYIPLKRCHKLFQWLVEEYVPYKQSTFDAENELDPTLKPILQRKIETFSTSGDVARVLAEFQGIRKFLDDYNAVAMDKVQLHLRINDFLSRKNEYNIMIKAKEAANPLKPTDFMLEYAPTDPTYKEYFNSGKFLFTNSNSSPRTLKVNFELLQDIYKYTYGKEKDYNTHYHDVYVKRKTGIEFERIYNTLTYPDSSVIANYMSIAPNINNKKGTIIMTYGYSGVGKSASLFGSTSDPTNPIQGILQATLQNFNLEAGKVEIYFRVFEIYGLGTQYNYYWNPMTGANADCYPNITQYLIHHVIDSSGEILKSTDQLVFTNRHDILQYILNLRDPDPASPERIKVTQIDDPNLGGKEGVFTKYFIPGTGEMIDSTYVKINKNHYNYFDKFVDTVDARRKEGIHVKKLLRHICRQIKGTINNPDSSRSILVYDFQINIDKTAPTPTYVPFIIYDLPGKEDIYRTYVGSSILPTDSSEIKKRKFKDIPGDHKYKEKKSTYVTNPILLPIFNSSSDIVGSENINIIMDIMTRLSNAHADSYEVEGITGGSVPAKFDAIYEEALIQEILTTNFTNFGYEAVVHADESVTGAYREDKTPFNLRYFYTDPDLITSFIAMFDPANLNTDLFVPVDSPEFFNIMFEKGLTQLIRGNREREIFTCIAVVMISILIKRGLFDIIVELISAVTNDGVATNDEDDGKWSRSKIYAFFEAYYINENVVGLLQYLIDSVLKKSSKGSVTSSIQIQTNAETDEQINQTISKSIKMTARYRTLHNIQYDQDDDVRVVDNDFSLIVNPELIAPSKDPLRELEIVEFLREAHIDRTDGLYGKEHDNIDVVYNNLRSVLAFENKGLYDSNRIFRSGYKQCANAVHGANVQIRNPFYPIEGGIEFQTERNYPLIKDFLEPYEQKIEFYYLFYVVSNGQSERKAEEQVKLLNNSMPFIGILDPSSKKSRCNS